MSYKHFTDALASKLDQQGYGPAKERFPVAARELEMNGFEPVVRIHGKHSFVVASVRSDGFKREQLRYLSDQYYNSLAKELNQLADDPTIIVGVCLFVFGGDAPKDEIEFMMTQARQDKMIATVRSTPWIVELSRRSVRYPRMRNAPFDDAFIIGCMP